MTKYIKKIYSFGLVNSKKKLKKNPIYNLNKKLI